MHGHVNASSCYSFFIVHRGYHSLSIEECQRDAFRTISACALLGGRVLGELNALGDVALEAIVAGLEKLLLVVIGTADDIDSLLGTTGAKLDGDGEELSASGLSNGVTALDTGKVDKTGLDETLLALGGPDNLVGESADVSRGRQRHVYFAYR